MSVAVRAAVPGDEGDILRMIRALADFEREPDAVVATETMLTENLFGESAHVHAHIAEWDGRAVGLALWFLNYSTWTGRPGLYLEDLFVDPTTRKSGVAKALMVALAEEAMARGCARMDWAVLDWNTEAMKFYERIGAKRHEGWQPWRVEGEGIAKLALTGQPLTGK
ncbi:GNAT family N-acetyltransferase [Sphingomonas sp. CGMCC 1.13654]|uniref:GNAT family N-acetyltransferase n=1 Tax=Sphingomonas chungangi TaxID=2683589 RepID=A0A838L9N7_9SPHN|nr:GNAT family N-acetyltransferase [Sphingomonas chungangi]MBA2935269.1 GNAT family N-acetyltransferase [Sphingomonas chungangi]MVW56776.1 GNAT family N-acetyltransferase [Sphingomonas chungangi]